MKKTFSYWSLAGIIFLLSISAVVPAFAGAFKDRDGATHNWSIGTAHQLIWDGTTYVPFGVTFQPKSFAANAGEPAFEADKATVEAIRRAGIADVLLKPGDEGITAPTPAAFQRIIDLLETNGLSYGIGLENPPYAPFTGYAINPAQYRKDGIHAAGTISREFPDADSALWVLCDTATRDVEAIGKVAAANGVVSVDLTIKPNSDKVLLFYPRRAISEKSPDWGLPDVWTDSDQRRDHLIAYFSQIKLGKGLRYFIDPLTQNMGIRGEGKQIFPTSAQFHIEFAAWLSKRYASPGDIGAAWGTSAGTHEIKSYEEAARLVPLWSNSRGIPYVYDDSIGKKYEVDTGTSAIWADFAMFRTQSVQHYMDTIADAVKLSVANVPVVYTADDLQLIFQPSGIVGFDGLAAAPAKSLIDANLGSGQVFSMEESSARPMWSLNWLKPSADFQNKAAIFSLVNSSRQLGGKGFILDLPDANSNVLPLLAECASANTKDKQLGSYRPKAIFYPQGISRAHIKEFSDGSWWLPTFSPGSDVYLGASLAGYVIGDTPTPDGNVYIWSLKGKQTIHFSVLDENPLILKKPNGESVQVKPKKGRVEFTVTDEPVMVRGIPVGQFVPLEVVEESLKELETALAGASKKLGDITTYQYRIDNVKSMYAKGNYATALEMARVAKAQLQEVLDGIGNKPAGAGNSNK